MTLDFSAYPNADAATKARTEQFAEIAWDDNTTDAALLERVQQGICLEARDTDGNTALIMAARNGCVETVHALLAAGANIEARATDGSTALLWSALSGRTATVHVLLAAGANIEARNNDGETALLNAAANGNTKTMQALLAAGANIETRAKDGSTALITAVWNDYPKIVRALLAAGANMEAQNTSGHTALASAANGTIRTLLTPSTWQTSYDEFVANGTAPHSAEEVYHLLAVTPLVNPRDPVDYVGNIQRIFANSKCESKAQAQGILAQMHRDGRINAETVDSILDNNFPEGTHRGRPTPRGQGIVR